MQEEIKTPILFIIFNRLDTATRVMEQIKKVRPTSFYIASDGPRSYVADDSVLVQQVRDYVMQQIDWVCNVQTLFQPQNLGCKKAVSAAINWFFQQEEQGIILEDDCLPDTSFFYFCQELLQKYKDEPTVGAISGTHIEQQTYGSGDYFLSKIPRVWGWATWRRTWNLYDIDMNSYSNFKHEKKIERIWSSKKVQRYWLDIFDRTYAQDIATWDYQLVFTFFTHDLLCLCPNKNLISNIGFTNNSTHTNISNPIVSNLPIQSIRLPLQHPVSLSYDSHNDAYIHSYYLRAYWLKRILRKIGLFAVARQIYSFFMLK